MVFSILAINDNLQLFVIYEETVQKRNPAELLLNLFLLALIFRIEQNGEYLMTAYFPEVLCAGVGVHIL